MKKILTFTAIIAGILLVFGTCQPEEELQAPTLLSPEDGAVFDSLPPTYIWSSDEFADGYKIMIDNDSISSTDCMISTDVNDTTYTMPKETFDTLKNGIYYWVAAACKDPDDNDIGVISWGESWSFVIQKPDPQPEDPTPPTLIAPADGSVLDTLPPTFVWSFDSLSYGYLFRIWTDTTTAVEDSIADTTIAMSQFDFDALAEGTYSWAAAAVSHDGEEFWSDAWTFTITRPQPVTDLDTTYFPFGQGYEWCFERHEWGRGDFNNEPWSKDTTFTYVISVVDSHWLGDTMIFQLEAEKSFTKTPYGFMPEDLMDICWDGAKIWDDKICLEFHGWVNLIPDTTSDYWSSIKYNGDTLRISSGYWDPHTTSDTYIWRLRGIGTINQSYLYYTHTDVPPFYYEEFNDTDRLLWFYNGVDTLYKASEES